MNTLKDRIRGFIAEFYDTDNPNRIGTGESFQEAKALVAKHLALATPSKGTAFRREVEDILRSAFSYNITIWCHDVECPLDRSWSITAVDPVAGVGYMVIICGIYPVITIRPMTRPVGEGVDNNWPFQLSFMQSAEYVQSKLESITVELRPIGERYDYTTVAWNDEALQQMVSILPPKGQFMKRRPIMIKAWDFLVYFDYVHG